MTETKLSGAGPVKAANHCNLKVSLAHGAGRELATFSLTEFLKTRQPDWAQTLDALVIERNPRVALAPWFEEEGCLERYEQVTFDADHIPVVPARKG
jgi:hypothetical protein